MSTMSFKIIIGVLFSLLIAAIGILGVLLYQNNQAANTTSEGVKRSYEVLHLADEISALSKGIQLESTAFFIDKDPAADQAYFQACNSIRDRVKKLEALTTENKDQSARIDSLEAVLEELISFNDSIRLMPAQAVYSERKLLERIGFHKAFRQRIRNIIDSIKMEEQGLLQIREKAHQESVAAFHKTFFGMLGGIFFLLVATFFSIRYNFNKRIKVQDELKAANELFSMLFHESPAGMVISRLSDGIVIDCNRAYAELVGLARDQIIGKRARALQIYRPEDEETIAREVAERGVVKDREMQLMPGDRGEVWVSVSSQVIQVNHAECLLSVVLDMTSHKLAEARIRQALEAEMELNKMKSDFLAIASHEFRTPLTTILSSAFLLENYSFGEHRSKAIKHVARIKSSVNNLTSILDEFLSLTRIEEGKVEPKYELLNLQEYLEGVCVNLQSVARPGQRIVYRHRGNAGVYTDPVLLANIVNNLVSNAIKYSPDHTEILVLTDVNSQFELTVKDSGIGIPKEDQKHLFERFYRASNAGAVQGTGLGLHIMKRYVDMLQGTIEVNSALGKGSEFKVAFASFQPPPYISISN